MPLARISEKYLGLRAAVFEGPGRLVLRDREISLPGPGEALVRILACGICGSDLNIFHRDPPLPRFWAGHEICGVVEDRGAEVAGLRRGAVVSVSPLIPCTRCPACSRGRENLCRDGSFVSSDLPGGFAEYITLPASNVYELPDGTTPEEGVLVEPLAAAVHAVTTGGPVAGKRALVIGAGTLGLLVVQVLSLIGATQVAVLGRYAFQRELALEMGADQALAEEDHDRRPGAAAFDIVFDTTGGTNSTSITTAIETLTPGGVLVLSGVHYRTPPMNLKDLTEKEIEVRGAQRYRRDDFVRALGLFAGGRVKAQRLVTHRVSLANIMKGFSIASEKKANRSVKVIVCP